MPVLQCLIPEAIPSHKCHMNMGPFLIGYWGKGTGNVAGASRRGRVHRQTSASVAPQLETVQSGCAVWHVVTSWNCEHTVYIFHLATDVSGSHSARFHCVDLHKTRWCMKAKWTQGMKYFIEFSVL